jgi:hypothetical protein
MSEQPDQPATGAEKRQRALEDFLRRRVERRRERLRSEIRRSRLGDHTIPTWVLTAILAVIAAGWLYLIISG